MQIFHVSSLLTVFSVTDKVGNLQFSPAKNFIDVTWNLYNPSGDVLRYKVTYKEQVGNNEKTCFTHEPSTVDTDCNEMYVPLMSCTGYDITVQPNDYTSRPIGVATTALSYTLPGKMKAKLKIKLEFLKHRKSQLIKTNSKNFNIAHRLNCPK